MEKDFKATDRRRTTLFVAIEASLLVIFIFALIRTSPFLTTRFAPKAYTSGNSIIQLEEVLPGKWNLKIIYDDVTITLPYDDQDIFDGEKICKYNPHDSSLNDCEDSVDGYGKLTKTKKQTTLFAYISITIAVLLVINFSYIVKFIFFCKKHYFDEIFFE